MEIKYKWENSIEYNYRKAIAEISSSAGTVLGKIEKKATAMATDYSDILKSLKALNRRTRALEVPPMYQEVQSYLLAALDSCEKAMVMMEEGARAKDTQTILKAARLVEAGNSLIGLTRLKNLEAVEKREADKPPAPLH